VDARSYMQLSYLTLEPSEIDMGEGRSERRNEGGSDEMISCVTYRQCLVWPELTMPLQRSARQEDMEEGGGRRWRGTIHRSRRSHDD
jgi:hypothetical protein